MINPEGKVVSRWHASNITYRTMKFFYVGRCWVMVWEGLVYKVLRISLGEYEDCNDSRVLCPEVRRWWIAWGLKEELAGLIGHEVWGRSLTV